MEPRPILLVKQVEDVRVMSLDLEHMLVREGYLVITCAPEQFDTLKVLAPCPFTAADVFQVREAARSTEHPDLRPVLESIASRMEQML